MSQNHKLKINDLIEGQIQTIAFGGSGILRHQGFVIFVPFTAPGDQISCRITEVKKSFAKAELVSILQPSANRAIPQCPYFGTCGGCQLQHLNYAEQLVYKQRAVVDALKRIGHLKVHSSAMVVPAHVKWAYRRHITLHLKPELEAFQAGYITTDNHSLIKIQTCPIFNEKEEVIISQLQSFVQTLPNPNHIEGRVTVLKNHRGQYILSFQFDSAFKADPRLFSQALQKYPIFAGILIQSPSQELILGDPYSEVTIEGLTFRFTPQAFIQNNLEQSTNIYRHIGSLATSSTKREILDLYCGFGITSLLLSQHRHSVIGIESNPKAIAFAQENSQLNNLKQARFIQGDVGRLLPSLVKKTKVDLVVVNPPRAGLAKEVIHTLLQAYPHEIIYVSCMPSTLARDLALLCKTHYEVQQLLVYDMFPQTAHVETLIHLKQKNTAKLNS